MLTIILCNEKNSLTICEKQIKKLKFIIYNAMNILNIKLYFLMGNSSLSVAFFQFIYFYTFLKVYFRIQALRYFLQGH